MGSSSSTLKFDVDKALEDELLAHAKLLDPSGDPGWMMGGPGNKAVYFRYTRAALDTEYFKVGVNTKAALRAIAAAIVPGLGAAKILENLLGATTDDLFSLALEKSTQSRVLCDGRMHEAILPLSDLYAGLSKASMASMMQALRTAEDDATARMDKFEEDALTLNGADKDDVAATSDKFETDLRPQPMPKPLVDLMTEGPWKDIRLRVRFRFLVAAQYYTKEHRGKVLFVNGRKRDRAVRLRIAVKVTTPRFKVPKLVDALLDEANARYLPTGLNISQFRSSAL